MAYNTALLSNNFFKELKQYNSTNFKALQTADLTDVTSDVLKAFSSTITRYFIYVEKHPELSDVEERLLYFHLKLDMVARFFSNYPDEEPADLIAFQRELLQYIKLQNESNTGGEEDV